MCEVCSLARAKRRSPKVVRQEEAVKEKEAILSWDKYEAGDFVSMDQFIVKTPGRLLEGFGQEGANNRFHGVVLSSMMLLLVFCGLRIKLVLVLAKPSLLKNLLSSGCVRQLELKSSISTATMVSLMQTSLLLTVKTRINLRASLVLKLSTKMPRQNKQSKLSCG